MTKEISESIKFPYKETDDIKVTFQLAVDYYSALHLAGHTIELEWNGGGDSGSVWINIDGVAKDIDHWTKNLNLYDKIHRFVIDQMYDALDYGSWAGEFSASGKAKFTLVEDFAGFEGEDTYSEDEFDSVSFNFPIKFPKHLIPENASRLTICISGGYDEQSPNISLQFMERGNWDALPLSSEATLYVEELLAILQEAVENKLLFVGADHTYMDVYIDITAGQDVDYLIENLDYYTVSENFKTITINLLEEAKHEE